MEASDGTASVQGQSTPLDSSPRGTQLLFSYAPERDRSTLRRKSLSPGSVPGGESAQLCQNLSKLATGPRAKERQAPVP